MITHIKNARILTMEQPLQVINGDIFVEDDLISFIGDPKEYKNTRKIDLIIDAKENLIMPGFKNAHSHCPMIFARSLADELPLEQWLNNVIFKIESKLTDANIYWFSQLAYMEYISSGITASFNMYYEPEAIISAATKIGFRTVLGGAINNFKESVDILETYYNKYNSIHDLISYQLGFHAIYTTKLAMMKDISDLAHKYNAPVHVHNSETKHEVEECLKQYGKTPTELLDSLGIYDYGGCGFHSTFLSDKDIEIYKRKNVYAVINTCSNAKLASGIAPVEKYIEQGVNLALGTDGASSNNALDMFREMYLTSMLQKLTTEDPSNGSPRKILEMATTGAAYAMGLYNCDVLSSGKKADLIMINLKAPCMRPIHDIISNLVYSGGKHIVMMTMINGKILYENGKFLSLNTDEILEQVDKMIANLCE